MAVYNCRIKGKKASKVRGRNIEQAANVCARRINRKAHANRMTGSPGMSGWFRAFVPWKHGGLTSTGSDFHVW